MDCKIQKKKKRQIQKTKKKQIFFGNLNNQILHTHVSLFHSKMSQAPSLPPPTDCSRQVGLSEPPSPIPLYRSRSVEKVHPDALLRNHLYKYKSYLDHEIPFISQEVQCLIERKPTDIVADEQILNKLQEGLKVRLIALKHRLELVETLLRML